MHIVLCLDERNGLLFNRRRLSSDQAVCCRILELAEGKRLWMSGYSAALFPAESVYVDEADMPHAKPGDICFAESAEILSAMEKVSTVTVFRWNRNYPSDVKFPMQLLDGWQQSLIMEFPGKSHERISEWRYVR